MSDQSPGSTVERHRERIVEAAFAILTREGYDAVSTRTVSAAAGVQAPVIYRLFGDKNGLLDAVAAHGFTAHLTAKKTLAPSSDPVDDLRAGWDLNVSFALANPALYALIWGNPRPTAPMAAAEEGRKVLREYVHRVAEAGRLRVREDLAALMVHTAGCGTALGLLAQPAEQRDLALSTANREALITAITTDQGHDTGPVEPANAAVTLHALLPRATALTEHERGLLGEWLERISHPVGR
ncbi:TetR/AcrR family transcriptional regulator [Umezawaea tangerina]|uniref:TetR/AcrR family transcriptional regulator n=1 Tax=Umezawaea tangerina TaxID=84725 RepID=UPI001FE96D8A|nr:TetR/AcrR family transcriptional regulator [Umezawaea tangerina]